MTRKRDLHDADLTNANLSNDDLSGADLHGADLTNATLKQTALKGANLRGARLPRATLTDADLRDANLQNADLHQADLRGANLAGSDLTGADLQDANFDDVAVASERSIADAKLDHDLDPTEIRPHPASSQPNRRTGAAQATPDGPRSTSVEPATGPRGAPSRITPASSGGGQGAGRAGRSARARG